MLFAAAIDVHSQEYKTGVLLGSLAAGAICGLWPLCAGLAKDRPVMGMIGFLSCIFSGYVLGCILALPVAFFFKSLIGAMNRPKPPGDDEFGDAPFNPYANGNRSAF